MTTCLPKMAGTKLIKQKIRLLENLQLNDFKKLIMTSGPNMTSLYMQTLCILTKDLRSRSNTSGFT